MREYLRIYRTQLLLFCAAPCLLAVLLSIAAYFYTRPSAPFRARGVEKLAVVKSISPLPGLKAELTYYFFDSFSKPREYKRVVPVQWKLMAESSRQIPVTHLAENADQHMIGNIQDIKRDDAPADYMLTTALLLVLGAAGYFAYRVVRIQSVLHMIDKGAAVIAIVSARSNDPLRKVKPDQISYHFNGPDGRWYEGRSPSLYPELLDKLAPGSKVAICFHPANPATHCPDLFGFRKKRAKAKSS